MSYSFRRLTVCFIFPPAMNLLAPSHLFYFDNPPQGFSYFLYSNSLLDVILIKPLVAEWRRFIVSGLSCPSSKSTRDKMDVRLSTNRSWCLEFNEVTWLAPIFWLLDNIELTTLRWKQPAQIMSQKAWRVRASTWQDRQRFSSVSAGHWCSLMCIYRPTPSSIVTTDNDVSGNHSWSPISELNGYNNTPSYFGLSDSLWSCHLTDHVRSNRKSHLPDCSHHYGTNTHTQVSIWVEVIILVSFRD